MPLARAIIFASMQERTADEKKEFTFQHRTNNDVSADSNYQNDVQVPSLPSSL